MKIKTISYAIAASLAALVGCTTAPTVEEMEKLGEASGYTTAYVLNNQVKVDDATRNGIIDVMNEVEKYVPAAGQTYADAWTPIAKTFLDKYVADKKITQEVADRVLKDFGYVVSLLDAYLEKKEIADDKDLVNAFVHSFFRGFLTNFKPANVMSAKPNADQLDGLTAALLADIIK